MAKAKTRIDQKLYDNLRNSGVRKKVAKQVSEALPKSGSTKTKPARDAAAKLGSAVEEIKDRVSGGPTKRSQAAKKAARTRKANAAKRSAASKKGARTRAKKKS